jgi:plasmid stability protein
MANLTIAVDDDVLHKARIRAAHERTSVNAVLREYLERWALRGEAQQRAIDSLLQQSRSSKSARGDRAWTRDELHDR